MTRNVLVTGGTGFIGSHVIRRIMAAGDAPILLKRSFSNTWRIKDLMEDIVFYDADVTSLRDIFAKEEIHAVVNLAAYYQKKDSYDDIEKMVETNIKFPTQLLELCRNYKVPRFITAGSFFQYDRQYSTLDGNTPFVARNLYAATKNSLEAITRYYASNEGISVFNLILFTPYGDMDDGRKLIPYIVKQALSEEPINLSEGFQKLNLVYVDDIADAFVKAIDAEQNNLASCMHLNIANRKAYSIREIVRVVEELLKRPVDAKWGAVHAGEIDRSTDFTVDSTFTERIMNWSPKITLYDGLKKTIDYYGGKLHEN
ncbi:MAG: NAD-dependent epimerase/dehydratase family protein [Thermoplasmataceae archaeon]